MPNVGGTSGAESMLRTLVSQSGGQQLTVLSSLGLQDALIKMDLLDSYASCLLVNSLTLDILGQLSQVFSRLQSQQSQVRVELTIFFGKTQALEALLDFALQFLKRIDRFYANPHHPRTSKMRKNTQLADLYLDGSNLSSSVF